MSVHWVDESFDYGLFDGSSCAFGVFDGLHIGHRYLLDQTQATAVHDNARSIALTFDIDPDEVFHPKRLRKLMRNTDRLQALDASGVDMVAVLPFTSELYSLSPEAFLEATFPIGSPAHMHVGENFRFGSRASGSVDTLFAWGQRSNCTIHPHHLVSDEGRPITATRIRLLLADCRLDEANHLLGHPYTLCETVRRGRGDGAGFGFATANLHVKTHDRVLGEGVYAAYATVDGARYKAAVSVGISPTFESESTANMEAHILDFCGDLVDKSVALEFIAFLRPMIKFESTDELIATVTSNIDWVRENL